MQGKSGGKNSTCGMDFALDWLLFVLHRCPQNHMEYSHCFLGAGNRWACGNLVKPILYVESKAAFCSFERRKQYETCGLLLKAQLEALLHDCLQALASAGVGNSSMEMLVFFCQPMQSDSEMTPPKAPG